MTPTFENMLKAILSFLQTAKSQRRAKVDELIGVEFGAMKNAHDDFLHAIRRTDIVFNEILARLELGSALGDEIVRELRRLYDFLVEHRYKNIAQRRSSYELAGAILDSQWPDQQNILVHFSEDELAKVRNLMISLKAYFETSGEYNHELSNLIHTVAELLSRKDKTYSILDMKLLLERNVLGKEKLIERWAVFARKYAETRIMLH